MSKLLPYGFVVVLVAIVSIWILKQVAGEYLKKSGASAFDGSKRWFARGTKFRRQLVRRYAAAIEHDFAQHPMGFVAEGVINIDEVYVPLQYELDGERQDIYEKIRESKFSVVVGPAGAGKSLLLKHSMITWARKAKKGRTERVPVLVELHRCNGTSDTIVDLVVAELARARLGKNGKLGRVRELVLKGLDDGALCLLLDGLDEVGRADQERVFEAIRDFSREYGDCQFIVTCRDVVYQGQPLGSQFSHVVRVAELDDAGVIRFLGNWRGFADGAARAEIFNSLRNNPALMRLARSPLLLTMIAYLHTEVFSKTGRRLPTSRPAFYQEAITHLLGRDSDLGRAQALTVYEVGEKLAVLQRVALAAMETTGNANDRLTISRRTLDATTRNLLPDLNLEQVHIKGLLDEIVDRSQLLVAVDKRKSSYVFRHLTLQEYLAASELADEPERLLDLYRADPPAWSEVVKLWCGASTRDCTKLIAEIFNSSEPRHKILALECLAEARRVDGEFAALIIEHFLRQLGRDGAERAAIVNALGTVAADSRPRGQRLLGLLRDLAIGGGPAKVDAMYVLSASGTPEAAQILAPRGEPTGDERAALRAMGELALPALAVRASEGFLWAIDDLAVVGTPAAAASLVKLLWTADASATRAAWRLAELVRSPSVETELRRSATPVLNDLKIEKWVWRPFVKQVDDNLLVVCGRVAWLLMKSNKSDVPADISVIDPRFGVPLALRLLKGARLKNEAELAQIKELVPRSQKAFVRTYLRSTFLAEAARTVPQPSIVEIRDLIFKGCRLTEFQRRVIGLLGWPVQAALCGSVLSQDGNSVKSRVRQEDWLTVATPRRNAHLMWLSCGWAVGVPLSAMMLAGYAGSVMRLFFSAAPSVSFWFALLALLNLVFAICMVGFFVGDFDLTGAFFLVASALSVPATLWVGGVVIDELFSHYLAFGLVALICVGSVCGVIARNRDRINENPYRSCLDASAVRVHDRTSVIGGQSAAAR